MLTDASGRRAARGWIATSAAVLSIALNAISAPARAQVAACDSGHGVERTVTIGEPSGVMYGSMTSLKPEASFLKRKEILLTFDDGPMPWVTRSILDTLDQYCAKATFFSVGRMALSYPSTVREILKRGHTLASHTYSHPFRMPHMKPDAAKEEIERGLAAVAAAAGEPIAPFFRFPGLSDSSALLGYLKSRDLVAFSVDIVSNDSYIRDPGELTRRTIAEVEARQGGIILFHDIKRATAKALPDILAGLKERGYKVVHMVPEKGAVPKLDYVAEFAPRIAKINAVTAESNGHLPFYGAIGPAKESILGAIEVKRAAEHEHDEGSRGPRRASPEHTGWTPLPHSHQLSRKSNDAHTAETRTEGSVSESAGWEAETKPKRSSKTAEGLPGPEAQKKKRAWPVKVSPSTWPGP